MANGAQELRDYMRDYFLPSYSPTKEAFINHSVWKYFKNRDYIVATECVLPGAVKFERRQVKIKGFEPGTRPPNLKAALFASWRVSFLEKVVSSINGFFK